MRVLLISPNREILPDPVFPIGLAYVAGGLKRAGHDVRVLDLLMVSDIKEAIKKEIAEFSPDAIGISLRNIDDVSYPKSHSYLEEYRCVVNSVRECTSKPIILGGSGFTIMPEEFISELGADYGVLGEGEEAMPEILRRLGRGTNKIIKGKKRAKLDETIPLRGLFDSGLYYRVGGMLNIQTKRGCPFGCIYCTYPFVEGRRLRLRDPKNVVDEMEGVVSETGVRHFFIVDSVFNYPAGHAEGICREIIRRNLDIKWTCYATPFSMTPKLVELMMRAGCTGVEFGIDSLDDDGLRVLGKNFDLKKIKEASTLCRRAGLRFCHFIFVGAPGDTLDSVKRAFSRLDEIAPDAAVIMAGIRIFPRTRLQKIAEAELGIKEIGLSPVFYISNDVLRGLEDIGEEVSKRRNWVMPGLEINVYERLQRRLRECGIKGPLWEGLSERIRQ